MDEKNTNFEGAWLCLIDLFGKPPLQQPLKKKKKVLRLKKNKIGSLFSDIFASTLNGRCDSDSM
jgi:hypothetical protein